MPVFRLHWRIALAAGMAICATASTQAQTAPVESSAQPVPQSRQQGHRERGLREHERALSESVRRFGRVHQDTQILSIEPILIHGRSLNRIKALDTRGRIRVWVDDPQTPSTPARRVDGDGDGDDGYAARSLPANIHILT